MSKVSSKEKSVLKSRGNGCSPMVEKLVEVPQVQTFEVQVPVPQVQLQEIVRHRAQNKITNRGPVGRGSALIKK